jgi:hypothetical protein
MQKKDLLLHINFMPRCAHNSWTYRLAQTNSSEVISFEDYHLTVADSKQTCISLALIVLVPLLTLEMITRTCNWHKQITNKFN